MTLQISSPAFAEAGTIPRKYTCDAENISPPLTWSGIPANAKSLALIVDDPDAPSGTWVHWVLYDIPSTIPGLSEKVPPNPNIQGLGTQGTNDFRKTGYGGPCPPKGPAHRYFFKLYALDTNLNLKPGISKADLEKAMRSHVLGQGQLIGKYNR